MAQENISELGFSTDDAVKNILRLMRSLGQYSGQLSNTISATAKFSSAGELTGVVLTALDKNLNRTRLSLEATQNGFEVMGISAQNATNRLKSLKTAIASIREGAVKNRFAEQRESEASQAKEFLTANLLRNAPESTSAGELKKAQAAISGIVGEVKKGNISFGEFVQLLKRAETGTASLTLREQSLVDQYRKALAAVDAFGQAATEKRASSVQDALASIREGVAQNRLKEQREGDAARTRDFLTTNLLRNAPESTSPIELKKAQAAISGIVSEVKKGNISFGEFIQLLKKAETGTASLTLREQGIVDQYQKAIASVEAFGDAAKDAADKRAAAAAKVLTEEQKVLATLEKQRARSRTSEGALRANPEVQAAQSEIQKTFGSRLAIASPQQVIAFNTAMQSAIRLLATGRVTATQFSQALQAVGKGQPIQGVIGTFNTLQNKIFAATKQLDSLNHASGKLFDTFQSVGRRAFSVFLGDALYTALGRIKGAMSESLNTAAEYSQKIALIRTITQDTNISHEEWSKNIRELSDRIGSPLIATATAAYDLLSNQVTRGAETFKILGTAMIFGRTTMSGAEDSVNLISSAVNSFKLGADGAERAARTFFTTIDLGRVTASELANSFGRSGVLAENAGVTMEELQATISVLTRQGIKANEAYTLINNVLIKLIKPTEELQGWLKRLGFETGPAAVAALGFSGVLEKLDQEFAGNTAKAAEFFDELRGARGILNLTGKNLDEFNSDLAKLKGSSENYKKAIEILEQDPGQRFQNYLVEFKNLFLDSFGSKAIRILLDFTYQFGGLGQALIQVTKGLITAGAAAVQFYAVFKAATLVSALDDLRLKINAASTATTFFGRTWEYASNTGTKQALIWQVSVSALAAAITAIAVYSAISTNDVIEDYKAIVKEAKTAAQAITEAEKEWSDKRKIAFDDAVDSSRQGFLRFTADVRKNYNQVGDELQATSKTIADSMGDTFESLKGMLGKSVTFMENRAKAAADNVTKARDADREIRGDFAKGSFERRFENADFGTRESLIAKRLRDLQKVATDAARRNDVDEVVKAYKEMDEVVAKSKVIDVESRLKRLTIERLAVLKQIQVVEDARSKKAASEAAAQKVRVAAVQTSFDNLKQFSAFNAKGEVKADFRGPEGRAKAVAEQQRLQAAVLESLKAAGANIPQQVAVASAFTEQLARLQSLLSAQIQATGQQISNVSELERLAEVEQKIGSSFEFAKNQALEIKKVIDATIESLNSGQADIKGLVGSVKGVLPDQLRAGLGDTGEVFLPKGFKADIDRAAETGDVDAIDKIRKGLIEAKKLTGTDFLSKGAATDAKGEVITLSRALTELKTKITEQQELKPRLTQFQTAYASAQRQIQALNEQMAAMPEKFGQMATASQSAGEIINSSLDPALKLLREFSAATADAINLFNSLKAKQAEPSGKVPGFAKGGLVGTSGVDNIPAMLARGEYVINSQSTKQFLPLLEAINKNPRSVQTTSVGDINVTVQGGSTAAGTVHNIASGLRRGIRRGTIQI